MRTIDRAMLYDLIYALAARDGREALLFGNCSSFAREAFARSVAGDYFPELWFELPLMGDPWFDLHALVSRGNLDPHTEFTEETCGGNPGAFAWFAKQQQYARQLALSWDSGKGDIERAAVQFLNGCHDVQMTCDFLEAAGKPEAAPAYRSFRERIPSDWFACYAGVFPERETPFLRVECIPNNDTQRAYTENAQLIEDHLRQAGLTEFGDSVVPRCQMLAGEPFQLEFQFDILPDGTASNTLSASVRFAMPGSTDETLPFEPDGAAGDLLRRVEEWGLADGRWRQLANTAFSARVGFRDEVLLLYCLPTFLKLRWKDGEPLDAKAYLIAGVQEPH